MDTFVANAFPWLVKHITPWYSGTYNTTWIKNILVKGEEVTFFSLYFCEEYKTLSEIFPVDFPFIATSSRKGVWESKMYVLSVV